MAEAAQSDEEWEDVDEQDADEEDFEQSEAEIINELHCEEIS